MIRSKISLSPPIPKVFILRPDTYLICISKEEEAKILMANERLVELKAFVDFLRDRIGFDFNVDKFDHRIALQKYVFIAKQLGWSNIYPYNIYARGPYSPDLANDYYALNKTDLGDMDYRKSLPSFETDRAYEIFSKKSVAWLEVAATIISIALNNNGRMSNEDAVSFALARTKELKSKYSPSFIDGVCYSLKRFNLIA